MARTARMQRTTTETRIKAAIDLDGEGRSDIATGIGFFDHMLTLLARHSLIDIEIKADGDLQVDAHHTVEDAGIVLGGLLAEALGDKAGIRRYGQAAIPMDEALAQAALDLSGRPFLVIDAVYSGERVGTFDTGLDRGILPGAVHERGHDPAFVLQRGAQRPPRHRSDGSRPWRAPFGWPWSRIPAVKACRPPKAYCNQRGKPRQGGKTMTRLMKDTSVSRPSPDGQRQSPGDVQTWGIPSS